VSSAVPFNRHLQFELVSAADDRAEMRLPIQDWFRQERDIVHGGVLSSLADTAAVYAIDPARSFVGVEFKINFLKAARMDAGPLTAHARVVRRGRRIIVCSADVLQSGEVVAAGIFTYFAPPAS
jgi:acyl-CoA thioesterase